jgi:hypothetical protein
MPNTISTTTVIPQVNNTDVSQALAPILVLADVAGPMCGRSEASWWRDHAAKRVPAPAWRAPGRTLWSVAELRAWVEAGCPDRRTWESMRDHNRR